MDATFGLTELPKLPEFFTLTLQVSMMSSAYMGNGEAIAQAQSARQVYNLNNKSAHNGSVFVLGPPENKFWLAS